ncbi:hypothetical protein CXF46_10715 [Corynebacterium bovis]|nr:hypothetical protein CXF36_04755 [Corynebacterium bovis]RRO84460.1 hypothetical protein CXF37_03280 [Corynebacterium bovis]RRO95939.1 hypothetical protein CXF29_03445 [Corynebacterium bovis]RRQ13446.1 hypothetical protein CXF47_06715 [Corynebacterium bovis]RRQ14234.1 hypothetical protein CXF46_10715 [Corynebacterium bovis]
MAQSVDKTVDELTASVMLSHPKTRLSESGHPPAGEAGVTEVREAVLALAVAAGFPDPVGPGRYAEFDRQAAKVLYELVDTSVADGRSTELWNFLTTCVLIDVAAWRYPNDRGNQSFARYLGSSPKSTFKKLWWRYHVLGDLSDRLGEDQAVALLERTGLAGDRRLARFIVEEFTRRYRNGLGAESQAFRGVMLQIGTAAATTCFEVLTDDQLREVVGERVSRGIELYRDSLSTPQTGAGAPPATEAATDGSEADGPGAGPDPSPAVDTASDPVGGGTPGDDTASDDTAPARPSILGALSRFGRRSTH